MIITTLRFLDVLEVGRYDGIELGFSECFYDGNTDWKFEGLLLEFLLVSVLGIKLDTNEGIKLGFSNRKVVGTTLEAVVGVTLGTYFGSELRSSEGCNDGAVDGKFDGLLEQWTEFISQQMKVLN